MTVSIDGTLGVTTPQIILTNGTSTVTLLPPASGTLTGTPVFQSTSGALTLTNTSGGSLILQPAAGSTTAQTLAFPATAGTNGQVLTSNGAGGSTWGAGGGGGLTIGTTAIASGTTGSILINTSSVLQQLVMGTGVSAALAANAGAANGFATLNASGILPTSQGGTGNASPAGTVAAGSPTQTGTLTLYNSGAGANPLAIQSGVNSAPWTLTLPTSPGAAGQVLSTNGSGVTSWVAADTVGGATTQVQYNNAGVLAGSAAFTYDGISALSLGVASTTTGSITLYQATDPDGITIESGVNTSAWTLTLPTGPGVSGELLSTDGAGNTSWITGGITIGTTIFNLGDTSLTLGGLTSVTVTQDPSSGLELATKQYVDAITSPIARTSPAECATLANIALTGLQTIDGYTTIAGDRVLVKAQTLSEDNGLYIAAAAAWSRAADCDQPSELTACACFVLNGTLLANTSWIQTLPIAVVGTDPQNWTQQAALNNYNAGLGINILGGNIIDNTGVVVLSGGTTGLTNTFTAATGEATLGGTLAVTHGGTGGATATAALTNLLPTQSGNPNKFLKTDGAGVVSWSAVLEAAGGANTQVQYNSSNVLAGDASFTYAGNGVLNLGVAGTHAGNLVLAGSTTGTTTIASAATAGNNTITLPTTSGQLVTAAAGGATTYTSTLGGILTVNPPNVATNTTWTYPTTNGANHDVLSTDGSGNTTWKTSTGTGNNVLASSPEITSLREKKTNGTISAGVLAIDCALGNVLAVDLNANITSVTFSNVPASGSAYSIILSFKADGTARTITWPAAVRWPSGTAPTMTSTNNKVDTLVLYTYDGGTSWFAFVSGQNA
jgi:hypothetical protein